MTGEPTEVQLTRWQRRWRWCFIAALTATVGSITFGWGRWTHGVEFFGDLGAAVAQFQLARITRRAGFDASRHVFLVFFHVLLGLAALSLWLR